MCVEQTETEYKKSKINLSEIVSVELFVGFLILTF